MPSGENVAGEDWLLVLVPRASRVPDHFHPVLDDYLDLNEREARAGIKPGTPIIISPDFEFDSDMARYFFSAPEFTTLNALTRESEGREIKHWLSFLDSFGVHWLDAQTEHFNDFRAFRTDPDVLRRLLADGAVVGADDRVSVISMGTFQKAHYALLRLYAWTVDTHRTPQSPIPSHVVKAAGTREGASRPNWLLPASYQLWRNIGLVGHEAVRREDGVLTWGEHDPSWKGGVTASRNVAYSDLMITSALRRREQSTLLLNELPVAGGDARLASAVAKYNRSRVYTPDASVLGQVSTYVGMHRAAAVARAKAEGRYDALAAQVNLIVVDRVEGSGKTVVFIDEQGLRETFDGADEYKRMRMFTRDESGALEPMMVWLTEAGLPMEPKRWNRVFREANLRVAHQLRRIGAGEPPPHVNPHALRFTFALYLLAALHRRIDERENYRETETYDVRRYGLAYDVVKDLLGHKQRQTTLNTYLEPVQGLRRATLFDSTVGKDLADIIGMLTKGSDRVLRTGSVFEEGA